MVERVGLEAARALEQREVHRIQEAVRVALLRRDPLLEDDHDTRLLHPGRTVLILFRDAGVRSADVLAAAAFVESLDRELAADASLLEQVAGSGAARLAADVPLPAQDPPGARAAELAEADDALLERIVTAAPEAALVALAERLDHARHVHLRPELDWERWLRQVEAVYAPAAARLCHALGGRYVNWAEAFRRRLLLRPSRP